MPRTPSASDVAVISIMQLHIRNSAEILDSLVENVSHSTRVKLVY